MVLSPWIWYALLATLMLDALFELFLVSSTIVWLRRGAGGDFSVEIARSGRTDADHFTLHGTPKSMLVEQDYLASAAALVAMMFAFLGGILILHLRRHAERMGRDVTPIATLYHAWLMATLLSCALTFSAIVNVYLVTYQHGGQKIDVDVAAGPVDRPHSGTAPYPLLEWTPEGWYGAVLELVLLREKDRKEINQRLTVMRISRVNLVLLFVLGFELVTAGVIDWTWRRRRAGVVATMSVD